MILARFSVYANWLDWSFVAIIIAVDERHYTAPIVLSMN